MKILSEFLARQLIDRNDYFGSDAKTEYEKEIALMTKDFQSYIESYKKHLKEDSPKTVQWKMIEQGLITALERMESRTNVCSHKWVERLDGYEEQCGPAICCLCGEYGCWCEAKWRDMSDEEKLLFRKNGINGNMHELEIALKTAKDTNKKD